MTHLESAHIRVVKPGWFTTVQDAGRYGYQQFGVSSSGPMDRRSFILANRLVGNRDDKAALEFTLQGPELLFKQDSIVALTGADLTPFVDGRAIPLWTSILLKAGSTLIFGTRRAGARCYLAIAGGIDVPMVMGSRSTHIASQIGGMKGRGLAQEDVLIAGTPFSRQRDMVGREVPEQLRPLYSTVATLRILKGPQQSSFSEQALEVLTTHPFRLSSQSDRMGYRLEGPRLTYAGARERISDATAMGALQVPPDEQPILLMADRQTTGGYPKIAVVISVDLHLAGQLLPGDAIHFRLTTQAEALAAMKAEWSGLDRALPPYRGHPASGR